MSGKATISDVTAEGFRAEQFGSPVDFTAGDGYIDTLLKRASNWSTQRLGDGNYAAATDPSYAFDALVRAEVAYVSEILWTRRASFLDGNANVALADDQRAKLIAQYYLNASNAESDAAYWIAEAQRVYGIDPSANIGGTGVSTGYIETGRFPQTSPDPLNVEPQPIFGLVLQ
ncbi:MAG TPA: hypothetical protein VFB54_03510 [Burkholderiales bacterium]|jgi:hypothetical protein|nr:hypothetical protein [Burkholderiales bacterium]